MARLVFNKGNLQQLKEGLDQLFDIFMDMLSIPFEHGNCFSHDDIMARMQTVVSPCSLSCPRADVQHSIATVHCRRLQTMTGLIMGSDMLLSSFSSSSSIIIVIVCREEDKADRGRGGKTTSGNGQVWSSLSTRGQWKTGENRGNSLLNHLLAPTTLAIKG